MIASIATSLGLSQRVVKFALIALAVVALVGAFYATLDAYGDSRYEQGEEHADQAWQDASDKLVQDSLDAGTKADKAAAVRQAEFAAQVENEKEKIDEAVAHGTSPLDVLFPSSGGVSGETHR